VAQRPVSRIRTPADREGRDLVSSTDRLPRWSLHGCSRARMQGRCRDRIGLLGSLSAMLRRSTLPSDPMRPSHLSAQ
jgi:hypothetical protein